eukprot:tig00021073_g18034.t1
MRFWSPAELSRMFRTLRERADRRNLPIGGRLGGWLEDGAVAATMGALPRLAALLPDCPGVADEAGLAIAVHAARPTRSAPPRPARPAPGRA